MKFFSLVAIRCAFTLIALMILSACTEQAYAPMATVANVDLSRYVGTWYEIAKLPNRFQAMCVSDTQAEYAIEGKAIRVNNRCRKSDGSIEYASGIAKLVEGSNNAKLKVSFFRPFYGNYWILDLDPDYRWVLVGEPSRQYGWVLARSSALDPATLNRILDKAVTLGYDRTKFQISLQKTPLPALQP